MQGHSIDLESGETEISKDVSIRHALNDFSICSGTRQLRKVLFYCCTIRVKL